MPFLPHHAQKWRRGSILVSEPDQIPEDALRRAVNVRIDRTLMSIEARPGWTARSAALGGSLPFLTRLFSSAATFGYAQIASALHRLNASWAAGVSIATPGTQTVSSAKSPDGNGNLLAYFVNGTIAIKDDGTTATTMGIAAPTAAPLSVALATDLSTTIDQMDDHTLWTGTSVGGKATDATLWQETPSSVSFTVAASTFGHIARYLGAAVDLDSLGAGADALVKNDDYIHLWIRVDRPDRLTYLQLDIDIDSTTTGVADAFQHNYYSWRGAALTVLSQGEGQWTKVQVRKVSFARFGTDTTVDWSDARTFRIGFLTNALGTATINVDDFKLRGGIGLEGDIEYTVCYRNSSTDARGNPPKDADGVVLYTTPLTVDRQRVDVTISNVVQGGAAHPGDAQITSLMIWRRGGTFTTAVLVDTIADTSVSPYEDATSDATLLLTNRLLETDNDVPPTGATRVLFGPNASGQFFMIVNGHRLYESKGYEDAENRVENWPSLAFSLIGDGSAQAVAGLATARETRVWTTELSYQVIGVGQDVSLPVAIDGSRGCVGQFAVTHGDNSLFFVSQDGIYEDRGGQQRKLTSAIDPFFAGLSVDGQAGWNTANAAMALTRLAFLHEATGGALVMVYAEAGSSTLNRFLVLKPNLETRQLTECFFGTSALTTLHSLSVDSLNRELLAGGANGIVYRIEDPSVFSDAGTAIAITARTKSFDFGQPQHGKFVSHATAEGLTTSQSLTLSAYYDRAATSESLGTVTTNTETAEVHLATTSPTTSRRDVALEVTGSVTSRVAITRLGCLYEPQPERLLFADSGILSYDFVRQCKRLEIDIDATSANTLTIFTDGNITFTGQLLATSGRQNLAFPLPPALRGRTWRITIRSSGTTFLMYSLHAFMKTIGTDQSYQREEFIRGI